MVRHGVGGFGYSDQGFKGPKRLCDRCGLTYHEETELKRQNGLWLCTVLANCFDVLEDEDD